MLLRVVPILLIASFYFAVAPVWATSEPVFCEPITVNTCTGSGVLHRFTKTPIHIPAGPDPGDGYNTYRSQKKALQGKRHYVSLLRERKVKECKRFMKPFFCAAYLPPCDDNGNTNPPCRDLCLRARSTCQQNLEELDLDWPRELDCSLFPTSDENPNCLSALTFGRGPEVIMSSGGSQMDEVEVEVECRYNLSPKMQPWWEIDGIPVAEFSERMRTRRTSGHSTTLIIQDFVDAVDRGNYTCRVGGDGEDGFAKSIYLDNIYEPAGPIEGQETGAECGPISYPTCSTVLPYSSTFEALSQAGQGSLSFGLSTLEANCPPFAKKLLCMWVFPKCQWGMTQIQLPCREVCQRAMEGCVGGVPGVRDACSMYPSQHSADECYNGLEIGEPMIASMDDSTTVEVECSFPIDDDMTPVWLDPDGNEPGTRSSDRVRTESMSGHSTTLIIEDFVDSVDRGSYTCLVRVDAEDAFSRSIYLGNKDIVTDPIEGQETGVECGPISYPTCSAVLPYSSTFEALSQAGQGSLSFGLSTLEANCPPFAKKLLCMWIFPKCQWGMTQIQLPCQEVCQRAMEGCVGGVPGVGDACSVYPFQHSADECYNGVEIGEPMIAATDDSTTVEVECSFPVDDDMTPVWLDPAGNELGTRSSYRVRTERTSGHSTTLIIKDFVDSVDRGSYKCLVRVDAEDVFFKSIYLGSEDNATDPIEGQGTGVECGRISYQSCSEILPYSSTFEALQTGQDSLSFGLSTLEANCPPFAKKLLCMWVFPKCQWDMTQIRLPCQEVCQQAIEGCVGGVPGVGDACSVYPSQHSTDECYNGLEIGEPEITAVDDSTLVEVECFYPIDFDVAPVWLDPAGNELGKTGRIRIHQSTPYATTLVINAYSSSTDGGSYSCSARGFSKTLDLSAVSPPVPGPVASEDRVPPQPQDLQFVQSHDSITISWRPPADKGILVRGYIVGYGRIIPDTSVVSLPSSQTEFTITGLSPESVYLIKLRAFNRVGESEPLLLVLRTSSLEEPTAEPPSEDRIPDQPNDFQASSFNNTIVLSWEPPTDESIMVRGYTVGYGAGILDTIVEQLPSSQTEFVIANVFPDTMYMVRLSAFNSLGEGPSAFLGVMTGPADESGVPRDQCPANSLPCPTGDPKCIPVSALCNGVPECSDGMDEVDCQGGGITSFTNCSGTMVPCLTGGQCISVYSMCDGKADCDDGTDEVSCYESACVPITVPQCSVGLDYSQTPLNHQFPLSASDVESLFSSLSIIFESACGAFFRPFMCAAFVPPCVTGGPLVQAPCRELCEVAVSRCLESFGDVLTEEDLMAYGGNSSSGCGALPSETDSQCYNVKEVMIDDVVEMASETTRSRYVDCTYVLVPGNQPKWIAPDRSPIGTDESGDVKVIHRSPTVTRLQIDNYSYSTYGDRSYTCAGLEYSQTVKL